MRRMERRGPESRTLLGRRELLTGAGAALLAAAIDGCSVSGMAAKREKPPGDVLQLAPLRAAADRITQITVCTRPFRAQGPRLDDELLQRAGARVTIYAKELPPNVRSSLASGVWTPDSRICFEDHATPAFKQLWANMARQSFQTYQSLLGLPGNPIEFIDDYFVSDDPVGKPRGGSATDTRPKFADLRRELIPDLIPRGEDFGPATHPFGERYLQRNSLMMFNISSYARLLMADFAANARALFGDESIIPVRGQLARMIPQPMRYRAPAAPQRRTSRTPTPAFSSMRFAHRPRRSCSLSSTTDSTAWSSMTTSSRRIISFHLRGRSATHARRNRSL